MGKYSSEMTFYEPSNVSHNHQNADKISNFSPLVRSLDGILIGISSFSFNSKFNSFMLPSHAIYV